MNLSSLGSISIAFSSLFFLFLFFLFSFTPFFLFQHFSFSYFLHLLFLSSSRFFNSMKFSLVHITPLNVNDFFLSFFLQMNYYSSKLQPLHLKRIYKHLPILKNITNKNIRSETIYFMLFLLFIKKSFMGTSTLWKSCPTQKIEFLQQNGQVYFFHFIKKFIYFTKILLF